MDFESNQLHIVFYYPKVKQHDNSQDLLLLKPEKNFDAIQKSSILSEFRCRNSNCPISGFLSVTYTYWNGLLVLFY